MPRLTVLALCALAACSAPPAPPSPIDRLVPPILERDHIPGAVVLVGGPDGVRYRKAFGAASIDTIWDLASCTKVVATTTAAMKLVEEGASACTIPCRSTCRPSRAATSPWRSC